MPTPRHEPLLVQIPPSTSPLLVPTDPSAHSHSHHHRYSNSADSFTINRRNPDIPDDLEFVAPGQWDESIQQFRDDEDDDDDNLDLLDDDDDIEDWTLEEGHIEGVPCANVRMNAKLYQSTEFLEQLFHVLRHDLAVPGWSHLPIDTPPTLIQVHKVSGSLTNAVFFVSIPETPIELDPIEPLDYREDGDRELGSGTGTPVLATTADGDGSQAFSPLSPATVFSELEKGRQSAATPTPTSTSTTEPRPVAEEAPSTPCANPRSLPTFDQPLQHDRDGSNSTTRAPGTTETILFSAPTLLLRIYGPSSGSLISRRNELHILHTLSSEYQIGPRVLGTFANGRVEEYFHSRALVKEEMRDPRISRWIGRRMRELHSVDLDRMIRPEQDEQPSSKPVKGDDQSSSSSSSADPNHQDEQQRPGLERNFSSGASCHSISSNSSLFSFGTSSSSSCYSSYSSSNADSVASSNSTIGSPSIYGSTPRSVVSSPSLLPQRPALETRASSKKRPRRKVTSSLRKAARAPQTKLCVWENITRWTREAKLVLNELDQLASVPGFERLLDRPVPLQRTNTATSSPSGSSTTTTTKRQQQQQQHVPPVSSPSRTLKLRAALNLPLFEQQLRLYRQYVHDRERAAGRSKRVFAHNDTQYGNLLLLTPDQGGDEEEELERRVKREGGNHKRIIVVDFEYAGANPRGFDIANHFCEWQADYHHESLSHSLSAHQPYPTRSEKVRFLRAYVGCDGGYDGPDDHDRDDELHVNHDGQGNETTKREDARVEKLLEEVKVWEPSSHAMWAVWGIVQAKEDLLARIAGWKEKAANKHGGDGDDHDDDNEHKKQKDLVHEVERLELVEKQEQQRRPEEEEEEGEEGRGREDEWEAVESEVFDYLSYASERMDMFRKELASLGVTCSST